MRRSNQSDSELDTIVASGEPGCAVRRALDDGSLDVDRWKSFQKLEREAAYQARELDLNAARLEKERWKKIMVQNRKRVDRGFR